MPCRENGRHGQIRRSRGSGVVGQACRALAAAGRVVPLTVALLLPTPPAGAHDNIHRPTSNRSGAGVLHLEGGTLVKDCSSIEWSWEYSKWLVTDQDEFRFYNNDGTGTTGTGAFFCGTSNSDHEGITFVAKTGTNADRVWVQEEATGQICEYDAAQIFDGSPTTFNRLRTVSLPTCGGVSFTGSTEGLVFVPDAACTTCGASTCMYGGYFMVGKQGASSQVGKFCVPANCPTQVAAATTSDGTNECAAVCVSLLAPATVCGGTWTETAALTYDWDTGLLYLLDDGDTAQDDICVVDKDFTFVDKYTLAEARGTQNEGIGIGPGRIGFCEDYSGGVSGGGSDCTINAPQVITGCGPWVYDTTNKHRASH